MRILLAEDNPVNQLVARKILTKIGYQVEIANNGKEAVEKYTATPHGFDLIFMDIQMPEMSGLEATGEIREWENTMKDNEDSQLRVPIVALTAHAKKEECIDSGMDDFIEKPIDKNAIFEIIKKCGLS